MPTAGMAEIILAKHRNGAVTDVKLRFLKDQARFADMDVDENSTAADPMGGGGGYNQVSSGMNAPQDDFGGAQAGGLGSSMGGEFGLDQGPLNIDKQTPLSDEVPF